MKTRKELIKIIESWKKRGKDLIIPELQLAALEVEEWLNDCITIDDVNNNKGD
jgi:hypothetical protein